MNSDCFFLFNRSIVKKIFDHYQKQVFMQKFCAAKLLREKINIFID